MVLKKKIRLMSHQGHILDHTLIKLRMNAGYFRPCSWEAAVIRLIQSWNEETSKCENQLYVTSTPPSKGSEWIKNFFRKSRYKSQCPIQAALQITVSKAWCPLSKCQLLSSHLAHSSQNTKISERCWGRHRSGCRRIHVWGLRRPLKRVLPGRDGALSGRRNWFEFDD